MCNSGCIYVQGHMPVMGNMFTKAFSHIINCSKFVCGVYTDIVILSAHDVIGIYCICGILGTYLLLAHIWQ